MRAFCFAAIGLSVAAAGIFGWRTTRTRLHRGIGSPYVQPFVTRSGIQSLQTSVSQVPSAAASANESAKHLGPFAVAGRDYTVELQTRKVQPDSTDELGDTVVAMEIRGAAGAIEYRRTFPYQEKMNNFPIPGRWTHDCSSEQMERDSWSVTTPTPNLQLRWRSP